MAFPLSLAPHNLSLSKSSSSRSLKRHFIYCQNAHVPDAKKKKRKKNAQIRSVHTSTSQRAAGPEPCWRKWQKGGYHYECECRMPQSGALARFLHIPRKPQTTNTNRSIMIEEKNAGKIQARQPYRTDARSEKKNARKNGVMK